MDIIKAVILGLVQGITEWLPVSSSGHLAILQNYFGLEVPVLFDVVLHVATLFVIIAVFWKDILKCLKALSKWDWRSEYGKLNKFIIIGSIPTAIIGYVFHDIFISFFQNLFAVGIALLVTGCILFLCRNKKPKKEVGNQSSLLIGIMQGLAIIPGISRSGATIGSGILMGVDRKKVARFSFLLATPAIIGATIFEFSSIGQLEIVPTLAGSVVSFIVGYFSLKTLLKLITQNKFWMFSIYCWILGMTLVLI